MWYETSIVDDIDDITTIIITITIGIIIIIAIIIAFCYCYFYLIKWINPVTCWYTDMILDKVSQIAHNRRRCLDSHFAPHQDADSFIPFILN